MIAPPDPEGGLILVNVLLIVAVAASVLALMLTGEDAAIQRSARLREAARAMAIAQGGERSAIVALRRDALVAPATDDLSEPWANIADRDAEIDGGRFAFVVGDAQARYNLNALARGDLASRDILAGIAAATGVAAPVAVRIAALLAIGGPIADLTGLREAGIGDDDIVRLATMVTALPVASDVNVNTAPEPLLAVLLGNAATARMLVSIRERRGRLTAADVVAAGRILPPGTRLTSDLFWSRASVTIGDTSQQLVSLLQRRQANGRAEVVAIARWRGAAAPVEAPPLPSRDATS